MDIDVRAELLAIVLSLAVAGFTWLRQWLQSKVTPTKLANVAAIAREAITAAEKLGGLPNVGGPEKYEFAEAFLVEAARRLGVKLTPTEAAGYIHAALYSTEHTDEATFTAGYNEAMNEVFRTLEENGELPEAEPMTTEGPVLAAVQEDS